MYEREYMAARNAQHVMDQLTQKAIAIVSQMPYREDVPRHEFVILTIGTNAAKLAWPVVENGKITTHEIGFPSSQLFLIPEQSAALKLEQA